MGRSSAKYIAAIHRNTQISFNKQLEDMEISSGQHDFLYVISLFEGLTQKELSQRLIVGKSTTAKAVKHLMTKGFIRRETDQVDKRCKRLYLSEKGIKAKPMLEATFKNVNDILFDGLSESESKQLNQHLQKVLTNIALSNQIYKEEEPSL